MSCVDCLKAALITLIIKVRSNAFGRFIKVSLKLRDIVFCIEIFMKLKNSMGKKMLLKFGLEAMN